MVEFAKNLKLSARGGLEITDLNHIYLEDVSLNVELLRQCFAWLDTGTHESLMDATNFEKTAEQGLARIDLMEVYEVIEKNQQDQYLKDVIEVSGTFVLIVADTELEQKELVTIPSILLKLNYVVAFSESEYKQLEKEYFGNSSDGMGVGAGEQSDEVIYLLRSKAEIYLRQNMSQSNFLRIIMQKYQEGRHEDE